MGSDVEWNRAAASVSKQIVRIESGDGYGTGFITHAAYDLRGIATAYHVVEEALKQERPITIRYEPTKSIVVGKGTGNDLLVVRDNPATTDAALLLFKNATDMQRPSVPLLEHGHMVVTGVEIGWLGFPKFYRDKPCFFSGRISSTMIDEKGYLLDGVAIAGVSGSPVFCLIDGEPKIIGSISAYFYDVRQVNSSDSADRFVPQIISLPGLAVANDVSVLTKLAITEAESGAETRIESD